MRRLIAVAAACALGACATGPAPQTSTVVRTRPPANVEPTVSSYFDLTVPGPQSQRKLVFGAAEASPCPLSTSGGVHLGWMVPVVYDTTASPAERKPAATSATSATANPTTPTATAGNPTATTPAAAARRQAKPRPGAGGSTGGSGSTSVGTGAAAATPSTTPAESNVTLSEVSISGTRFFFWFSADTLSGVTRRADLCP